MKKETKNPLLRNPSILDNVNTFLPLQKVSGPRPKREIIYDIDKSKKHYVGVYMYESLDIFDEDVLFSILYLCKPKFSATGVKDCLEDKDLLKKLELNLSEPYPPLILNTTIYSIIKVMGKSKSKALYDKIKKSLWRLAKTSISFETQRYIGSSNFLSYNIDRDTKELRVIINPISIGLLTGAINSYNTHNLNERFSLPDGMPRKIHRVLNSCSREKNKKKSGSMYLTNLIIKVKDKESATPEDIKQIKKYLSKMNEKLNWEINIIGRGGDSMVHWKMN